MKLSDSKEIRALYEAAKDVEKLIKNIRRNNTDILPFDISENLAEYMEAIQRLLKSGHLLYVIVDTFIENPDIAKKFNNDKNKIESSTKFN